MGILSKLAEVSSPQMMNFFGSHRNLLMSMLNHQDCFSVAQLTITLMVENFAIKEKKTDILTEESLRVSSMEQSYQNIYGSSSRTSLFREIHDVIFPCFFPEEIRGTLSAFNSKIKKSSLKHSDSNVQQMLDSVLSGMKSWTESLKESKTEINEGKIEEEKKEEVSEVEVSRLLINEVLKEEIKNYPVLVKGAKALMVEIFKFVVSMGTQARKIENVSFVLYSVLCKFLELVRQDTDCDRNNHYMNRMGE